MAEAWPDVKSRVAALSATVCDDSEPFKAQYEALSILSAFLEREDAERTLLTDAAVLASCQQGILYIQVEENSAGERILSRVLRWAELHLLRKLEERADDSTVEVASAVVESCNYLALVYSGWDVPVRSLVCLRFAKAVFRGTLRCFRCETGPSDAPGLRSLHSLFTHTLFYYAQIYGKLGGGAATGIAARYIEQTLLRQLREQQAPGSAISTTASVAERGGTYSGPVDGVEWARNAMRISEFHLSRDCGWAAAAHCLVAADVVTALVCKAEESLSEPLQRLRAESAVHWAQIYCGVLAEARKRSESSTGEDSSVGRSIEEERKIWAPTAFASAGLSLGKMTCPRTPALEPGSAAPEGGDIDVDLDDSDHEGDDSLFTGPGASLDRQPHGDLPFADFIRSVGADVPQDFVSYSPASLRDLPVPGRAVCGLSDLPIPGAVRSFESARDVFKAGLSACTRALEFFVLDGFVTEHVEIHRLMSKLYKYLGAFETDLKRSAAMCGRRVALLAPLLSSLNPAIYISIHKELSIEAASAAQESFQHKLQRLENAAEGGAKPTPVELRGVCDQADSAMRLYSHFLRCYNDPRLGADLPCDASNKPVPALAGATALDSGSAEAYMTAHFCIARLAGRCPALTISEKLARLACSLNRYEWVAGHAAKVSPDEHNAAMPFFKDEVDICREMMTLIPRQIDQLVRGRLPATPWL